MNILAKYIVIYLTIVLFVGAATEYTFGEPSRYGNHTKLGVGAFITITRSNNTTFTNMSDDINSSIAQLPQQSAAKITADTSIETWNIWDAISGTYKLLKGLTFGMYFLLKSVGAPETIALILGFVPSVLFWVALALFVRGIS